MTMRQGIVRTECHARSSSESRCLPLLAKELMVGDSEDKTPVKSTQEINNTVIPAIVDVSPAVDDGIDTQSLKSKTAERDKRPLSAWARGPPKFSKATSRSKEALSAFAAPYSFNTVAVDPSGDIKEASLVPPLPSLVAAATAKSAWTRGPPHLMMTVATPSSSPSTGTTSSVPNIEYGNTTQEVELPIPTPTHAHLMPPISAWTVHSTDSDPAAPWDPAILAQQPQSQTINTLLPAGFEVYAYQWGMPLSPVNPGDLHHSVEHHIQRDPGLLWTPSGWAVQDAAMKRAMVTPDTQYLGRKSHRTRRGSKNYYRSKSSLATFNPYPLTTQSDHADSMPKATVHTATIALSERFDIVYET